MTPLFALLALQGGSPETAAALWTRYEELRKNPLFYREAHIKEIARVLTGLHSREPESRRFAMAVLEGCDEENGFWYDPNWLASMNERAIQTFSKSPSDLTHEVFLRARILFSLSNIPSRKAEGLNRALEFINHPKYGTIRPDAWVIAMRIAVQQLCEQRSVDDAVKLARSRPWPPVQLGFQAEARAQIAAGFRRKGDPVAASLWAREAIQACLMGSPGAAGMFDYPYDQAVFLRRRKDRGAVPFEELMLSFFERIGSHLGGRGHIAWPSIYRRGSYHFARNGNWPAARRMDELALAQWTKGTRRVRSEGDRISQSELLPAIVERSVVNLLAPADPRPDRAFEIFLDGQARGLDAILNERNLLERSLGVAALAALTEREKSMGPTEAAVTQASVAFDSLRIEIAGTPEGPARDRLTARLPGLESALAAANRTLDTARLSLERERDALLKRLPRRALAPPLPLRNLPATLPPGSVYAGWLVGERNVVAAWIGADREPRLRVLPLKPAQLEDLVEAARDEVVAGRDGREALGALTAAIVPDGMRAEIARAKLVVFNPDGPLWRLPLGLLPIGEAGRPVGLTVPVVATPGLSVWQKGRLRSGLPARTARALIVGMGTFGPPPKGPEGDEARSVGAGAAPLPGARKEAIEIAAIWNVPPVLDEAASEAAITGRIGGADVVHFASHAFADPARPLSGGVLLGAGSGGDGVLQGWEVLSLPSLRAGLVVLSACDTGRGKASRNEGVVGLARSFAIAGARAVVASSWRVPDASTRRLMTAFHRELAAGTGKAEALRRAMRGLADAGSPPREWAPFVLLGDEAPLVDLPTSQSGS